MALTQYCELEEVRAALGVNDDELPDAVLNLPVYEMGLVRELAKVSASLPAAFSSIQNAPEASWTDLQRQVHDATRLFSVYACARQVGVALGAMAPKTISDGKANVSRFSDSPYKDVMDRLEAFYASARAHISEVYAQLVGATQSVVSTTPPTMFMASTRSRDPVTG